MLKTVFAIYLLASPPVPSQAQTFDVFTPSSETGSTYAIGGVDSSNNQAVIEYLKCFNAPGGPCSLSSDLRVNFDDDLQTWVSDIATAKAQDVVAEATNPQEPADWTSVTNPTQIINKPAVFPPSSHEHAAGDIVSGVFFGGRISQSSVAQHQGTLVINSSQITGAKPASFIANFTEAAQDALASILSSAFIYDDQANTLGLRPKLFTSPTRTLVSGTNATGYQISSSRDAFVCYGGKMNTVTQALLLSGGASEVAIHLETAQTNSSIPSDWTTLASQNSSQSIALGVALTSTDGEPWSICRVIPAGRYVRLRTQVISGTGATFSINPLQQEVLL